MNQRQRAHYFRDLWPAACAAQGWDRKDEARRHAVTLEVTGTESTCHLTEAGVSALFDHLKHLGDPFSLEKAMPVANPEVGEEAHRRRQLLYVMDRLGFPDAYIARCAEGVRRADGARHWREMRSENLQKVRFTLAARARQRDVKAGKRGPVATRGVPYDQRKSTKAKRAAAREPQVVPRPAVAAAMDLFPF